jgi:hypothetical protein
MTDHILTDIECQKLAYRNTIGAPGPMRLIRAVEQAVLAKVRPTDPTITDMWRAVHAGCVTEREARERERRALDAWGTSCEICTLSDFRDKYYPLQTCDKCGQEIK